MAVAQVFDITELCEEILHYLPITELLRAQQVCREWKNVITRSTVLQEQLFLRSIAPNTVWLVDIVNLPNHMRPIFHRHNNRMHAKTAVSLTSNECKAHYGLLAQPVKFNPFFERLTPMKPWKNLDDRIVENSPLVLGNKFVDAIVQPDGSWKDMFLTQPAVQYVTIEFGAKRPQPPQSPNMVLEWLQLRPISRAAQDAEKDEHRKVIKIYVQSGVTMKDIAEKIPAAGNGEEESVGCMIWMHGAVVSRKEDDELMLARTRRYKAGMVDEVLNDIDHE